MDEIIFIQPEQRLSVLADDVIINGSIAADYTKEAEIGEDKAVIAVAAV